jgi:hypothetical protein
MKNQEPGEAEGIQSKEQRRDDLVPIENEQPYCSAGMRLTEHTVN